MTNIKKKKAYESCSLAEKLLVTKIHIRSISKNGDKIFCEFDTNEISSKQKSAFKIDNEGLNKLTWKWFTGESKKNPNSGLMPQEKAL